MTTSKQTRSAELKKYGITLNYLANLAKRSESYVKQWSAGNEKSPHLDRVANGLIAQRKKEQQQAAG
ncbi:hypothetical protein GCM10023185_14760 [Hymenobacter saemangeumensis]|uniref:XRE family transcriptional regulator n=1 Tax=Hymenobacter saemangeumensis TaxID=1084522 RepID=A0ABP8I8V3_9BACT